MFFSTYVLTKKGPLAKVWLAAHWDRRLTRHEVKVVDLSQTIMHIVKPVVPIALRTSGELLVGVVRIYALKVRHLLKEATEATLLLRVATVTSKSGTGAEDKTTAMEGLLVGAKGDVEAVTLDWSADLAAKHGSFPEAAEALAESRFDAIADLLGARSIASGLPHEDALVASAWYTVEPNSQAVEELHTTQQDYDDIAKMRADLLAFGERASNSTSKSKSSLSSIEKGRGSTGFALGGDVLPVVGDDLDIGIPVPEEMLDLASTVQPPALMPEDPFALPEILESTELVSRGGAVPAVARKPRPANILDLAATTLPREVYDKLVADRRDILNAEPRRGPLDEEEARDRHTLTADWAGPESTAMLSAQPSEALRALYGSILQLQVAEAVAEAEAAKSQRHSELLAGGPLYEDELPLPTSPPPERKHRRDDDEEANALSHSAVQTLQRLRTETAKQLKRKTTEHVLDHGCSFLGMCQSHRLGRREAAKAFVAVLALASKEVVAAQQSAGGDIAVQLLPSSTKIATS